MLHMRTKNQLIIISIFLLLGSCITQFVPDTEEVKELLVVEGLITDQNEVNTVKLSKSLPLGKKNVAKPVMGCFVTIQDDRGVTRQLFEISPGTYVTNPNSFRGVPGRKYTLKINTNSYPNYSYESIPMEMKPVPSIDTLYYDKVVINESNQLSEITEGCHVYLDTHDAENKCQYYRWDYIETWEFRIPFEVQNRVCWITNSSGRIQIKTTSVLEENRINRYALNFISNATDRLKVKYSMLVNQYSINEDEYLYWEKLKNVSEDVGSLYDITPATIQSNITCIEDPKEKVLGYFSVSARSSKRIFIKDTFMGIGNLYSQCISDTILGTGPVPGLYSSVWVIMDRTYEIPPYRVVTEHKGCADCTTRGTTTEPLFWRDDN